MLLRKKTYQFGLVMIIFAVGSLFAVNVVLAVSDAMDNSNDNTTGSTQEYGANDAGNGQENKVKSSFESNYEQVLFSLVILFLLIIVLLRYVYRFRIKKKKYIGDEDNASS